MFNYNFNEKVNKLIMFYRFWKIPECYIRGNSIKYLRIPDEVIDQVTENEQNNASKYANLCFLLQCT